MHDNVVRRWYGNTQVTSPLPQATTNQIPHTTSVPKTSTAWWRDKAQHTVTQNIWTNFTHIMKYYTHFAATKHTLQYRDDAGWRLVAEATSIYIKITGVASMFHGGCRPVTKPTTVHRSIGASRRVAAGFAHVTTRPIPGRRNRTEPCCHQTAFSAPTRTLRAPSSRPRR